ncbi:hypothetical protein BU17DRAFT_91752 [Hysterangium stoloniferum]|nr:hypothetical protein BU17DRAFT_91752 [Hysterangium stoloniferum]
MESTDRPLTPPTVASDRPVLGPFHKSLSKLDRIENISELVKVAEDEELTGDARDQDDSSRLCIIAPLVLGYLILDDIAPARYALTRLPNVLIKHPLSQALLNLLAATWDRKHSLVIQRAQELTDLVSAPSFFNQSLATLVRTLSEKFINNFQERTFALISRAYSSVSLPLLQSYLTALPVDQLLSAVQQRGWSYDGASQILSPPASSEQIKGSTPLHPSTLNTFYVVTEGAAGLESVV